MDMLTMPNSSNALHTALAGFLRNSLRYASQTIPVENGLLAGTRRIGGRALAPEESRNEYRLLGFQAEFGNIKPETRSGN